MALVVLTLATLPAATSRMPVDEIEAGMQGTGVTVFDGTRREPFDVHVLGVLTNVLGPRRSLIVARLEGGPLAQTGVIRGMSGSPVYIEDRLVGAVSYALGSFSREAIAGITPIEEMAATDGTRCKRHAAGPRRHRGDARSRMTRSSTWSPARFRRPSPLPGGPATFAAPVFRRPMRGEWARYSSPSPRRWC